MWLDVIVVRFSTEKELPDRCHGSCEAYCGQAGSVCGPCVCVLRSSFAASTHSVGDCGQIPAARHRNPFMTPESSELPSHLDVGRVRIFALQTTRNLTAVFITIGPSGTYYAGGRALDLGDASDLYASVF